nr:F-box/kelch-repeat protein At1g16250-like [Ipomoea batatas]
MGSVSTLSRHHCRRSQEQDSQHYRVYASFCGRNHSPNVNMSNWISCFNPSSNSWHRVASIPGLLENHVLKRFAMIGIGDWIYVIGGRHCLKYVAGDAVHEKELGVLGNVQKYNVVTNKWCKCKPLKTPRFNFACTVADGKIYVAGGQTAVGSAEGTSSTEVYDPSLDEWKSLPNMNTMRYKCAGVTWQGKIHVVGGFAKSGHCDTLGPYIMERSSADVYDPMLDKWDVVTRMWELDVPPYQIVNVDGNLFSSGDCLNAWKGHIEAYDGRLKIWNVVDGSMSPISTSDTAESNWPPTERMYCTMAPIGTKLYFLAGYRLPGENSRCRNEVHVFDTAANGGGWTCFEPIEEEGEKELCSHCCALKMMDS